MKLSTREAEAISEPGKKTGCRGNFGCIMFSVPFLLAGALLLYFLGVQPAVRVFRASSWTPTPCVITSSKVASSSDSDTYAVDIHYSYTIDGRQYESKRYNFAIGYTSGRDSKSQIVEQHPPGSQATCFVNPLDPTEAVMARGFNIDMLWGLFGLPFFLVGATGLFFVVRGMIQEKRSIRDEQSKALGSWQSFGASHSTLTTTQGGGSSAAFSSYPVSSPYPVSSSVSSATSTPALGRHVLESTMPPGRKLVVTVIFALIWNGIVSVFLVLVIKEWGRGNIEWILALFLTPFVLIGLLLLYAVVHGFLGLFNPRPRLTINSRQLRPGEAFDLDWQFSGSAGSVRKLRIYLEGREEATYRRGTDTLTDKNVFATHEIVSRPNADPGRAQMEMPGDSMHSFASEHNKIVWEIHITGEIKYWADIDETFVVEVLPNRVEKAVEL